MPGIALVNPPRSVLLGRPDEITYRHASDGLDYVHKFDRRDRIMLTPSGRVEIRAPHRLWTRLHGKPYLENPGRAAAGARRGRSGKGRTNARHRAGSGHMAGRKHARRDARGRFIKSGRKSNPPRKRHASSKRSRSVAVARHRAAAPVKRHRSHKRTSVAAASRAGRTLRFRRRNPPIVPTLMQSAGDGLKAAGGIVAEGALANQIEKRLPGADKMGPLAVAGISHVVSASAISIGAHMLLKRWAPFIAAGAWAHAYLDVAQRHSATAGLLDKVGFSGYASGYNVSAGFSGYAESGVQTPAQRLLAGGFRAYANAERANADGFAGYDGVENAGGF